MSMLFTQHYTLEEARALLPHVRCWFSEIDALTNLIRESELSLSPRLKMGEDLGGHIVNSQFHDMQRVHAVLGEFHQREIQIKDLNRGLIDFPALLDDREVFLCWEKTEGDITHWHSLESGFSDRQPLLK